MRSRIFLIGCCFLALASAVRAGIAEDLVHVHIEAIGGRERLAKLRALRVLGRTQLQDRGVRFVMWARRPNAVRIETVAGDRKQTQAWDGVQPPWQQSTIAGVEKPAVPLGDFEARELQADADFDDPLVAASARGDAIDFAGEASVDGRETIKLLVTRNFTEQFTIYLDATTYLIVRRDSSRRYPGGRVAKLVTRYDAFQAVAGVMMPRRIAVESDGKPLHETVLDRIEPNPALPADFFRRPLPRR